MSASCDWEPEFPLDRRIPLGALELLLLLLLASCTLLFERFIADHRQHLSNGYFKLGGSEMYPAAAWAAMEKLHCLNLVAEL